MARHEKTSDRPAAKKREHTEDLLDRALADTFPASDPVELVEPGPPDGETKPAHRTGPRPSKKPASR